MSLLFEDLFKRLNSDIKRQADAVLSKANRATQVRPVHKCHDGWSSTNCVVARTDVGEAWKRVYYRSSHGSTWR